jgi:predicted GNAT family N-acyltransferase
MLSTSPNQPRLLLTTDRLDQFDCGNAAMNDWLKKHAIQSQSSGHAKTLAIVDDEQRVLAYCSYSVVSVEHEDSTPERVKKGLAKYPIPIFLIARLAVDRSAQGKKHCKRFLRYVLQRAAKAASEDIPLRAVVVDAIDDTAKKFYAQFDFTPWPIDGLRLWLLMKDLQATLKSTTESSV